MSFSQDTFKQIAASLGRSEDFIEVTQDYARDLIANGKPVIFSTYHLSLMLGVNYTYLNYLIEHRNKYYRFYKIAKKKGGVRSIVSPHEHLKEIQRFILERILNTVTISTHAYGFVKQRSIKDNASVHVNASCVLNIDLFKFFDCITEQRVYGIFRSFGYAKNLSVDLAKLVTVPLPDDYLNLFDDDELKIYRTLVPIETAVLPQGAPTSPAISNIVLRAMDSRFSKLAAKSSCSYSRYADDLTFSGEREKLPCYRLINQIITEEGFAINERKVRMYRKGGRQTVTGLTLEEGKVFVNRKFKMIVRKNLYACLKFGVDNHKVFIGIEKDHYKEWLLGKIMFIYSVEPITARKYLLAFNKIQWTY